MRPVLPVVLLAAACVAPSVPNTPALMGDWEIMAVNGEPTGGGDNFILSVTPPMGWAQFGCNVGSGPSRVENGQLFTDWIITVAGCRSEEIAWFERQGFDVLGSPTAIRAVGGGWVRLSNARGGSIDLRPMRPVALAGTRWKVIAVNGQPPPASGTIRLEAGTFEADFGCNRGGGSYRQEADLFRPSVVSRTEAGCMLEPAPPVPLMTYEGWGFAILSRDARIRRTALGIELTNERGTILLERAA